jgi:hypothetical protein
MTRLSPLLVLAAPLLALAPSAAAQTCVFQIDSAQSQFTWSGTTTLGDITEQPGTFALQGTLLIDLAAAGDPASTGELVGGGADVVPDLSGFVGGPFGVHLLDLSASNLSFAATSAVFEGNAGAFSAELVLTANSGVFNLVPLIGSSTSIDITGAAADAVVVSGTIAEVGGMLELSILNLSSTFDLMDPVSGVGGSIVLAGQIVASAPAVPLCDTQLFAEPLALSIGAGGTQNLVLDAGPARAGKLYIVLGSASGTAPGLPGPPALPLNFDAYFKFTLINPNTLISNSLGFLDGSGKAHPAFSLAPASIDASLAGVTLNHAAVVLDASFNPVLATNAEPLTFQP